MTVFQQPVQESAIRHSAGFFLFTGFNLLLVLLLVVQATVSGSSRTTSENRALAKKLELTDLCLFTEARYTRHPAMADTHAAFQEHPAAFDHFPSGSLLVPAARGQRP